VAISIRLPAVPTDEEIAELSRRNPGYRFERTARGELRVTPTGGEAGRRSAEVVAQLHGWNRARGLGVVCDSSAGFRLPDGSLLAPDASWVELGRWEALDRKAREGFPPLCPDAVFEVASPSDLTEDLREKAATYIASGARVAVLIDSETRSAEIYRPGRALEKVTGSASLRLDPELPGLELDLRPVFSP
jgi:Uma2 family endonuclease